REPYESRGSRTDLGAPGGESPPGDSTRAAGPITGPDSPQSDRSPDRRFSIQRRRPRAESGRIIKSICGPLGGFCTLGPENASLTGLPVQYIVQQMADF